MYKYDNNINVINIHLLMYYYALYIYIYTHTNKIYIYICTQTHTHTHKYYIYILYTQTCAHSAGQQVLLSSENLENMIHKNEKCFNINPPFLNCCSGHPQSQERTSRWRHQMSVKRMRKDSFTAPKKRRRKRPREKPNLTGTAQVRLSICLSFRSV